ncbi:extensin-like domain-containing protein [Paracoccus aminovorans]|uniref:extensin-like domain-containing protein n=1 Tax=Paracoccus aminovorans TaxID=34004 RepID=UPI000783D50F|nr:extensin family protein [Paracoccus aminovorans]MDQ7775342.1 extensin family protein [Paracoccus aminovorans]
MRALLLALLLLPGLALAQDPPAPRPMAPAEERPAPRPAAEPAVPAARPEPQGETPGPEAPKPQEGQPAPEPVEPAGPPVHTTLRESDFDHSACLLELTLLGADYAPQAPLTDPDQPDCGIDRPILLHAPLPGIEIPGGAPMRCDTARQLAHWLRDFVRPASALLPGQPRLMALEPGSTYQCRATVGNDGTGLSEHAFGNAFDIAAFRFDDGSRFAVEPRADKGDLAEAFQRAVRGAACLYFTTVLGPGANAAHDNHLHLDIKARRGGWRLCQ